jgi:hypothetical protein
MPAPQRGEGWLVDLGMDAACQGRKDSDVFHKATRAIVCGSGAKKEVTSTRLRGPILSPRATKMSDVSDGGELL